MSPLSRALVALVIGLATGALCSVLLTSDKDLLYALGLAFGAGVALFAGLAWRSGYWRMVALVLVIGAAWPAAHYLTLMAFDPIGHAVGKDNEILAIRLAMQVGNLVGGALTIVAPAIAARVRPGAATIVPTLLVGAAAAAVAVVPKPDGIHGDIVPQILFPAWQAGVLFFSVLGLGWKRRDLGLA